MRCDEAYLIGGPRRRPALRVFVLVATHSIYGTVLCMIQCLLHSHASIVFGASEYRLSEIIFFPLLKQRSHSADIAGIDRASNANRLRFGHFAWSFVVDSGFRKNEWIACLLSKRKTCFLIYL
jgi:hypothetical protein